MIRFLYVHFRGRERLRVGRQMTDHSTVLAPLQLSHVPVLRRPNRPLLSTESFPELKLLREN